MSTEMEAAQLRAERDQAAANADANLALYREQRQENAQLRAQLAQYKGALQRAIAVAHMQCRPEETHQAHSGFCQALRALADLPEETTQVKVSTENVGMVKPLSGPLADLPEETP
jgi:hypothetical protein